NNVARLRHFSGTKSVGWASRGWVHQRGQNRSSAMPTRQASGAGDFYPARLAAAGAIDLNFEVADFLAQRVAVDPEEIGGADLIAAGGRERRRQQRPLDLAQDAMIEAGRRQGVVEAGEILRQIPLHRDREIVLGA